MDTEKNDGLLIVPESDFEEQYLRSYHGKKFEVFLKHGESVKNLIGLKIRELK